MNEEEKVSSVPEKIPPIPASNPEENLENVSSQNKKKLITILVVFVASIILSGVVTLLLLNKPQTSQIDNGHIPAGLGENENQNEVKKVVNPNLVLYEDAITGVSFMHPKGAMVKKHHSVPGDKYIFLIDYDRYSKIQGNRFVLLLGTDPRKEVATGTTSLIQSYDQYAWYGLSDFNVGSESKAQISNLKDNVFLGYDNPSYLDRFGPDDLIIAILSSVNVLDEKSLKEQIEKGGYIDFNRDIELNIPANWIVEMDTGINTSGDTTFINKDTEERFSVFFGCQYIESIKLGRGVTVGPASYNKSFAQNVGGINESISILGSEMVVDSVNEIIEYAYTKYPGNAIHDFIIADVNFMAISQDIVFEDSPYARRVGFFSSASLDDELKEVIKSFRLADTFDQRKGNWGCPKG